MSPQTRRLISYPCPKCGAQMAIVDSRPVVFDEVPTIRRRRRCGHCGERFNTHEIVSADYDKRVAPGSERVGLWQHTSN